MRHEPQTGINRLVLDAKFSDFLGRQLRASSVQRGGDTLHGCEEGAMEVGNRPGRRAAFDNAANGQTKPQQPRLTTQSGGQGSGDSVCIGATQASESRFNVTSPARNIPPS